MFLNHLLLTYNSEKEFVGWNSTWEGNEPNLGTKSRSGNSFKRKKEGEAPHTYSVTPNICILNLGVRKETEILSMKKNSKILAT